MREEWNDGEMENQKQRGSTRRAREVDRGAEVEENGDKCEAIKDRR